MNASAYARDAIDERLRRASDESATMCCTTPRVDMGREAIDQRLREVADLRAACVELGRLGPLVEHG